MRVLALTGRSGAGKTTAIVGLIRHLRERGFPVGAIKHTHHPLNEEDRGDTAAFRAAGANPVILAAESEAVVFDTGSTRRVRYESPEQLLTQFPQDAAVLVEGFNAALPDAWPRIALDREHRPTLAALIEQSARHWQP